MTIENDLKIHIHSLAGDIGERNVYNPDALAAADSYIEKQWSSQGYAVTRYTYEAKGVQCANLEVTLAGNGKPDEIILIGAHYDSVRGSPGANDNASGVAAALALSKLLANASPHRTVRFTAFVNEEQPFFNTRKRGSRVYVKMARKRGDNILGAIILETIGCYSDRPGSQRYPALLKRFYPDRGNFIGFVSNLRSRSWLRKVVAEFESCSDFPSESTAVFTPIAPGAAWSDHSSFWQAGYKALMVTDTAFYRYPYYHTSADTPDKINYRELARVTEGLSKTIISLAGQ